MQEVETQALVSQQKIQQTQGEINAKKRETRLNQLTSNELASLTSDTKVYEGVGKMSVLSVEDPVFLMAYSYLRFVSVPPKSVNDRLSTESITLKKDIADLEKKLHYQETTFKNSREHIDKILQSGAAR